MVSEPWRKGPQTGVVRQQETVQVTGFMCKQRSSEAWRLTLPWPEGSSLWVPQILQALKAEIEGDTWNLSQDIGASPLGIS